MLGIISYNLDISVSRHPCYLRKLQNICVPQILCEKPIWVYVYSGYFENRFELFAA